MYMCMWKKYVFTTLLHNLFGRDKNILTSGIYFNKFNT